MAFVAITAGQVDADSPLDTTLMTTIKDNFDDHETRIGAIESPTLTVTSDGSQVVTAASTWTPTVGIYQLVVLAGGGQLRLELFIGGAWRQGKENVVEGIHYFDGTNMRLIEVATSNTTVYWQKFT